ncbi:MAG: 16S rRNA (uracil(1498)-N(3))-methyltransferase [Bacteroidales bacterium]|jgi:16S rRNA (uracil1498-N3)-methyltransferase|nr:16S rRNA (uracil(1498)-N(3))-methyltransferase [Bacteroidales bacterium]
MNFFYSPEPILQIHILNEQESRHCIKSLRLRTGDKLHLMDGKGNLYMAKIIDDNVKACSLEIVDKIEDYPRLPYHLHIGIAPTKNSERLEWFVEKAVEIGISEITTLLCENSERTSIKSDRIERLMISAIKQSLRIELPVFTNKVLFDAFLDKTKNNDVQKFIAYCGQLTQPPVPLKTCCKPHTDTLILIGPEGDFSKNEVCHAMDCGFIPVSLGKFRLRTETAALLACSTVQIINESSV